MISSKISAISSPVLDTVTMYSSVPEISSGKARKKQKKSDRTARRRKKCGEGKILEGNPISVSEFPAAGNLRSRHPIYSVLSRQSSMKNEKNKKNTLFLRGREIARQIFQTRQQRFFFIIVKSGNGGDKIQIGTDNRSRRPDGINLQRLADHSELLFLRRRHAGIVRIQEKKRAVFADRFMESIARKVCGKNF